MTASWHGIGQSLVSAGTQAGAQTSTHWCGGTLLFVREADGHSFERCSGCEWSYDFDKGRVSDASALVGWTR